MGTPVAWGTHCVGWGKPDGRHQSAPVGVLGQLTERLASKPATCSSPAGDRAMRMVCPF
jgi:hypothetical protein